jgi:hypothetical protein
MTLNEEIQYYENILDDIKELFYGIEHRDIEYEIKIATSYRNVIITLCYTTTSRKKPISITENIERINDFLTNYNNFLTLEIRSAYVTSPFDFTTQIKYIHRWAKESKSDFIYHLSYLDRYNKNFGGYEISM